MRVRVFSKHDEEQQHAGGGCQTPSGFAPFEPPPSPFTTDQKIPSPPTTPSRATRRRVNVCARAITESTHTHTHTHTHTTECMTHVLDCHYDALLGVEHGAKGNGRGLGDVGGDGVGRREGGGGGCTYLASLPMTFQDERERVGNMHGSPLLLSLAVATAFCEQDSATHCNQLQHAATVTQLCRDEDDDEEHIATHCNALQHVATRTCRTEDNAERHAATHCNTLQHAATLACLDEDDDETLTLLLAAAAAEFVEEEQERLQEIGTRFVENVTHPYV